MKEISVKRVGATKEAKMIIIITIIIIITEKGIISDKEEEEIKVAGINKSI